MKAGSAPEVVDAYVRALLDLLGDDDPLEILEATVEAVRAEVDACPAALRRAPEAEGKWSVVEVVRHLADMEGIFWYRLRRVLAQPGDPVQSVDQDAWASAQDYAGSDPRESLDDFAHLRSMNLRWLRRRDAAEWSLQGNHAERGPESLRRMVELLAGHDRAHLRQLARIRAAVVGDGPG